MGTVETLQKALSEVQADLDGLEGRRASLEEAAGQLRQAIAALDGGSSTRPARQPKRRGGGRRKAASSTTTSARPTVTPDDLVDAVRELGGSASVEQLVEKLGLPDGRSLNGARRRAVDEERIAYADRTYTLPSSDPRWPEDGADASEDGTGSDEG